MTESEEPASLPRPGGPPLLTGTGVRPPPYTKMRSRSAWLFFVHPPRDMNPSLLFSLRLASRRLLCDSYKGDSPAMGRIPH